MIKALGVNLSLTNSVTCCLYADVKLEQKS